MTLSPAWLDELRARTTLSSIIAPSVKLMRAGREWKASWKAGTSGDYRARVTGVDALKVGGKTIDAYRVETLTNFRGDLKGKASIVTWVDAKTRAIVATNGALNLSASYGSYNTNFETSLRSAPGY